MKNYTIKSRRNKRIGYTCWDGFNIHHAINKFKKAYPEWEIIQVTLDEDK